MKFSQFLAEFPDSTSIKVGDLVSHGLILSAKVVRIVGSIAEIVDQRDGKHYKLQLSSLKLGAVKEGSDNYAEKLAKRLPKWLKTEKDILAAADDLYDEVVNDLGRKQAGYLFSRDPDFLSDMISAYRSLTESRREPRTEQEKVDFLLRNLEALIKQDISNNVRYKSFQSDADNKQVWWVTQEGDDAENRDSAIYIAKALKKAGYTGYTVNVQVRDQFAGFGPETKWFSTKS